MAKLNKKYEQYFSLRKPTPPPTKEIRPRKEHTREKNDIRNIIEEGIEEYEKSKRNN